MLDLHGKGADTLVVASGKVQVLRSEVELICGHGFRNFEQLLFDAADLAVHGCGYGWRRRPRLLRLGTARGCAVASTSSPDGEVKDQGRPQQEGRYSFHSS